MYDIHIRIIDLKREDKMSNQTTQSAKSPKTPAKAPVKKRTKKVSVEILREEKEAVLPETAPKETIEIFPKKKILFVASEATPFIATGGLAEVIGSLSKALAKDPAYDVRVVSAALFGY